jgi:hypothetical protein
MAIVSVEQLFEGRGGGESVGRKLEHTQVFEVITNDVTDDQNTVGLAPGLPLIGQSHPTSPSATLTDIKPSQSSDSPYIWQVTCTFSSDLPREQAAEVAGPDASGASVQAADPTQREENPLNRPATYKIDWEQSTEIASEAYLDILDGEFTQDIVNSAGDPFDPPAQMEVSYAIITIEKNYAIGSPILDFGVQEAYQDATNSDVWHGLSIGSCRIIKIGVSYEFENGVAFGRVTYQVKVRRLGWDLKIADCGFNYLTEGGTKSTRIDKDIGTGVFPDSPTPLNGTGGIKAVGAPIVYLSFRVYPRMNFTALGV